MNQKLLKVREELNNFFLERREEIDILLTAILSQKNVFLVGATGTAKSQLCNAVAKHFSAKFFTYLMTDHTTPDELFGIPSIKAMKEGRYERIITNKLPNCEIAFLDEIFKANSSILNCLLKIINEKKFDNGNKEIDVPLISLFTASNELPKERELVALYDRLHFRKIVKPIAEFENIKKLLLLNKYEPNTIITRDELKKMHEEVGSIETKNIDDFIKLLDKLKNMQIFISDRKKRECIDIIKGYAYLNNKDEMEIEDFAILQHVLWNEPQEATNIATIILQIANPFDEKAKEISNVIDDLENQLKKYSDATTEVYEIYQKLINLQKEIKIYKKTLEKIGKKSKEIEDVDKRIENLIENMRKEYFER